jgi:uncharacterized protein (DUF934 family)
MDASILPATSGARVLTRDGTFTADSWPVLDDVASADGLEPALLPLARYLAQPQPAAHGVWLAPTDNPGALAPYLSTIPLIAVQFPKFTDGRGYSIAALLRRLGYRSDLRAIGEVLIDQLFMLKRVGFTSFALRADQSEEGARAALNRFSDAYQPAWVIDTAPYRRGRAA